MSGTLAELEPRGIWTHFLALTRIPRPPKQEDEVRAHVLAWAAEHGLETAVDGEGNAVARVPATEGREDAPTVVLQSHLDMVCERDPDSPNDPREGRIEVVRDDDWVLARGTTLGADNGIGVAAAMAIAEDPEVAHGPLELLFTVSEEQGLEGAKALDPSLVSGKAAREPRRHEQRLAHGRLRRERPYVRPPRARPGAGPRRMGDGRGDGVRRARRALRGRHREGPPQRHQGARAFAVARARGAPFRLVSLDGGVSRNAIPREARAVIAIAPEAGDAVRNAIDDELAALRAQYRDTDGEVTATVEPADAAGRAAEDASTQRAAISFRHFPPA